MKACVAATQADNLEELLGKGHRRTLTEDTQGSPRTLNGQIAFWREMVAANKKHGVEVAPEEQTLKALELLTRVQVVETSKRKEAVDKQLATQRAKLG